MKRKRGRPRHEDVLTPTEWRIVHYLRHGLTNRQIAERRGVSVDAVKYHVSNALAKLGLADRGALRSWVGYPIDSPVRGGHALNDHQKEFLGLGQVSRATLDIEAALRWYRDVLGLDHLFTAGDMAFFDVGGTRLMLSASADGVGAESILYLRVADIREAHERLSAAGVHFLNAPHRVHRHDDGSEEWMAFFEDPEKRPLALMSVVADV